MFWSHKSKKTKLPKKSKESLNRAMFPIRGLIYVKCLGYRSPMTRLSRRFARNSLRKVQSGMIKQITFPSPSVRCTRCTCLSLQICVHFHDVKELDTEGLPPQGKGERAGGRRENSNKPGSREKKLASRRFAKRDPLIYASPTPTCDANNDAPPERIK